MPLSASWTAGVNTAEELRIRGRERRVIPRLPPYYGRRRVRADPGLKPGFSARDTMRFDRPVLVRWVFSGLFAAMAICSLSGIVLSAVHSRSEGWGAIAFVCILGLLFFVPFALSAYFCFKRRYRDLFMVGAGIAAIVVLSLCFTIPRKLGVFDGVPDWKNEKPWRPVVMLPLSLLFLFGPFYLAGWFLKVCSRFAVDRIPNGPGDPVQPLPWRVIR